MRFQKGNHVTNGLRCMVIDEVAKTSTGYSYRANNAWWSESQLELTESIGCEHTNSTCRHSKQQEQQIVFGPYRINLITCRLCASVIDWWKTE